MSTGDQGNELELAELLREVRSLRQAIDELKSGAGAQTMFGPNYAVAADTASLRPDYAVLVRTQLPFIQVVDPAVFQGPTYEVAVRTPIPQEEINPLQQ